LKPRGIYIGDSLYSQADVAEEIYFVTNGQFTMYVDMQKQVKLPEGTIDPNTQAFNVPYSTYAQGSYFGDADCLCDKGDDDSEIEEQ
jgi:hypothetical protein